MENNIIMQQPIVKRGKVVGYTPVNINSELSQFMLEHFNMSAPITLNLRLKKTLCRFKNDQLEFSFKLIHAIEPNEIVRHSKREIIKYCLQIDETSEMYQKLVKKHKLI